MSAYDSYMCPVQQDAVQPKVLFPQWIPIGNLIPNRDTL